MCVHVCVSKCAYVHMCAPMCACVCCTEVRGALAGSWFSAPHRPKGLTSCLNPLSHLSRPLFSHLSYGLTVLVFTLIWGSRLSSLTIAMEILARAQGCDSRAPVLFCSVTCYTRFTLHRPLLLVTASAWVSASPPPPLSPAVPLLILPIETRSSQWPLEVRGAGR